jgi:hypothetical protein
LHAECCWLIGMRPPTDSSSTRLAGSGYVPPRLCSLTSTAATTGGFILIVEATNCTVGAGMIIGAI